MVAVNYPGVPIVPYFRGRGSLALAAAPPRETPHTGGRLTDDIPLVTSRASTLVGQGFTRTARPDRVTLATYDEMRTDGVLTMALALIKMPVLATVKGTDVAADDPIVEGAVRAHFVTSGLLYRIVRAALSSIEFGVSFNEKQFVAGDLAFEVADPAAPRGTPPQRQSRHLLLYKDVIGVNPGTITEIKRRTKEADGKPGDGSFDGFVQGSVAFPRVREGDGWVHPPNAFIYTNEMEYGNFWGKSRLKAAYPYWYWKQIILKLWMAWAEKKAQPTRVVRHPQGVDPRSSTDYREIALEVANQIDAVSAVALPNSRQTTATGAPGEYLWTLDELVVTDRTDVFERIVKRLDTYILWSVFVPERVFQEGQYGTKAEAEAHTNTFMLTEDALVTDIFEAVTRWVIMPWVRHNFGADAAEVRLGPGGLTDEQKGFVRQVFTTMLTNADFQQHLDFDELAERLELPVTDEASRPAPAGAADDETPVDEEAEPEQAPNGEGPLGRPPNLVLDDFDDDDGTVWLWALDDGVMLKEAFNPARYDVTPDGEAKLGFKVLDKTTGKRLSGFAAIQVIKAFQTYQQKAAEKAQSKAERAAEKAQRQSEQRAKEQQRAQEKSGRDAERKSEQARREGDRAKRQGESDKRRAEAEGRREGDRAERKQRQGEADERRTAAERKRDERERRRDQEKADTSSKREQDKLDRDRERGATGEERQTMQNARGERIDLERQTGRAKDAQAAAQAIRQAGWTPSGGTAPDRTAAVAAASAAASGDADSIYSVVRVPGGYQVVKKPKKALSSGDRAANVSATEASLDEDDDLDGLSEDEVDGLLLAGEDEDGYAGGDGGDAMAALIAAAERRLAAVFAAGEG